MPATDVLDPMARRALLEVLHIASGVAYAEEPHRSVFAGAAAALGLSPDEARARSLDEVPLDFLSARDRLLVYVAAAWMVLADGIRTRAESELLEALAERLQLDAASARFLDRQARWVRTSTGDRPAHRELDLLLTETARRLAAIAALRAA